MAPRPEFSTENVQNKARKKLLYLLEAVSDPHLIDTCLPSPPLANIFPLGPRKEERRFRSQPGWAHWTDRQGCYIAGIWRRQVFHSGK